MTMKRVNKKILQKSPAPSHDCDNNRLQLQSPSRTQGQAEVERDIDLEYLGPDVDSDLDLDLTREDCSLQTQRYRCFQQHEKDAPETSAQELEVDLDLANNRFTQNSSIGCRSRLRPITNTQSDLSDQTSLVYQNSPSNACSTNACSNGNNVNHVDHRKKREKMGILKNLRRKFSSLSVRKSDTDEPESYGHLGEQQPHSRDAHLVDSLTGTQHKDRHTNERLARAARYECSPNSPLKTFMSPKFSEWHSNTDHHDVEFAKNKPGCFSKDISRFNPSVSSMSKASVNAKKENIPDNGTIGVVSNNTNMPKSDEKHCRSEAVYELADCVEYDPVKEQTRIWSPKVWSLTQELFRLSKFGWYWGPITRNEAEDKLTNQPDGAFLVRDSSDERYLLSLSFRSFGRTLHTRIEHCNGMFSFYAQPDTEGYPSIVDLIERSMNDSQTGIFYYSRSSAPEADQIPVRLTKPVSRFTQVQSLQHMCRFVIRQYTRYDHIQQLPLPNSLKGWIEENQYWAVS